MRMGRFDAPWRRICRPVAEATGQQVGAAGRCPDHLEPMNLRSDRLVVCTDRQTIGT